MKIRRKELIVGFLLIISAILLLISFKKLQISKQVGLKNKITVTNEPKHIILLFKDKKVTKVKNNPYLDILFLKWRENKHIENEWIDNPCIQYWLSSKDNDMFNIEVREYHGQGCKGYKYTNPLLAFFRISKTTEKIYWYDVTSNQKRTYEEWLELNSKE